MKRLLACTLALAAALVLGVTAFADVLWEPIDDQFYDGHWAACKYEGRGYYANGKDGFITVWDVPDGDMVKAQYRNGERFWVGYTYKGWALINLWGNYRETVGWAPLEDLYLVYDHISFAEEYGDQFRDYNGEFADYDGEVGEVFWFWEYPNAWETKDVREVTQNMLEGLLGTSEKVPCCISKVYMDQNGHDWGFVEWLWGDRDFWLLLDNPTGGGIMTSCIPEVDDLIASGEIVPPQEPVLPRPSYLPYILVALVIAATACLLKIFWKK